MMDLVTGKYFSGYVAEPSIRRLSDGSYEINWPDSDPEFALVHRAALELMVKDFNEARGRTSA